MKRSKLNKIIGFMCSFTLSLSLVSPLIAEAETINSPSNTTVLDSTQTVNDGFDSLLESTTSPDIILNSLVCDRVGSITPNSSVKWTLDVTGEGLNYKYDLYKDGKIIETKESTDNSFLTLIKDAGTYYLNVTITTKDGASINAKSEEIIVKKLYIPVKINLVESSATSININNTVKWTSYASGDGLIYKWNIYKDNKLVYTSSESKNNSIDYKVTETGKYKALSTVKDEKGTVATMYSSELTATKPAPPKPPTTPSKPPTDTSLDKLVKSSAVYATITKNGKLTSSMGGSSTVVSVSKGSKVEILSDKGAKWYNVRDTKSGKSGWIASSYLSIPKDPATNKNRMTTAQMEQYVNSKGFSSGTQYFIWVDIDRQLTNIFSGKKGSYKLIKSVSCATGQNRTPTTRGTFTVSGRGAWFSSPTNPSVGAKYFTRFNGSYLFHSTLYSTSNKNQAVDSRVGVRLSHGCIRLPVDTAKWIYDNAKPGTKVWIN